MIVHWGANNHGDGGRRMSPHVSQTCSWLGQLQHVNEPARGDRKGYGVSDLIRNEVCRVKKHTHGAQQRVAEPTHT